MGEVVITLLLGMLLGGLLVALLAFSVWKYFWDELIGKGGK